MKWRVAFPLVLVAAALPLAFADSSVRIDLDAVPQPAPKSSTAAPSSAKSNAATTTTRVPLTTPGKAAPPPKNGKPDKKGDGAKKDEPPAKIDGLEVSRGEHGFLGIKVENNTWKVSFYDKKKKPTAADVSHIALRWPVQYQPNPERALLSPTGGGKAMTSEKTVRPPFAFTLYVTLLKDAEGTDQPAETYVVEFHQ